MWDPEPFLREFLWLRDSWKSLPDARKLDQVLKDLFSAVEELSAAHENSPAGHLVVNRRGVIVRANNTARHLLRTFEGSVAGRRLYDFIPSDWRDALFLHLRRLWKTGRPERVDLPLKRRKGAGGRRAWVRLDSNADVRSRGTEKILTVNLTEVTEERRLHEQLLAERARLHTLLEQMPAGVVIAEAASGRVTLHNRMAERILGGLPPMNRLEHYERVEVRKPDGQRYRWWEFPMARAIRAGEIIQQEEIQGSGPEGEFILSVSAAPVRDSYTGKIIAGALAFQDVTSQKAAQREQARLAAIVNSSDDAIIRQELDGTITHWNPAAERIYGYSAAEMVGRHARVLVPEELRGEAARLISHAARGEKIRGLETVRIGRGGRRIDIGLTMTMIPDEAGRPEAVSSIERDITERKQAEIDLWTSRQQLELATTAGEIGLWNCDLLTGEARWSAQLYQMLGLVPLRVPEHVKIFFYFIHPDDRQGTLETLETLLANHDQINFEFRVIRADGRLRWLASRGRVERDADGRALHMRGVNIDVTDRRRAEDALAAGREALARKVRELERSNQELSEFAYAVSHDLKAPLRAVRNYANFLEEDLGDSLGDDARLHMEGMKKAIGQGDRLIRDLLDFSRIRKRGKAAETVKLGPLVEEVQRVLDPDFGGEIQIGENAPPFVADLSLLKRVLMNLISNGLKFNDSEDKRVEIRSEEMPGDMVRIVVSDNGIGIGEDYQGQVFRVFQRLHPPSAYEGTGIGLAIVKKAVLAMGGDVRLESTPGEGSTFLIELPREPPSNGENAEEGEGAEE